MKVLQIILLSLITVTLYSCQKEPTEDRNITTLTLSETGSGNCVSVVHGTYQKDSTLNTTHYIDVQVNSITPTAYDITSDTINGFHFAGTGTTVAGVSTIRLYGHGQPQAAGVNTFTITYDTSSCQVAVNVTAVTAPAVFQLGTAGNTCLGIVLTGNYHVGVPLNITNTAAIGMNVTVPGVYNISTSTVNGVTFSASGVFTQTGYHQLVLTGIGTPTAAGTFNYNFPTVPGSCILPVSYTTVIPGSAVFTLGGAGAACTGAVVTGTYIPTRPVTDTHNVKINVNVTTIGSYSISSNTVGGVGFSGTGTFTTTGLQTVTLKASGVPDAPSTRTFTVTVAGSSCTFSVVYEQFTYLILFPIGGGMNQPCSNSVVSGTYTAGVPLNATNTIQVRVQAGYPGYYYISMYPDVNGMNFSTFGYMPAAGIYDVIVPGTGTPIASGVFQVWPIANSQTCSVPITVN